MIPNSCRLLANYTPYIKLRVESGLDDPDNLGDLGHFFGGSSGSHLQTKLPGCDLDITCSLETVLASVKWANFGSDECTEISLVWNQHFISSCFEACGVQRCHLLEVCVRDRFCILPAMKKFMALFHIKRFSCHVTLLSKKTSTCGSQMGQMWVTSGLFCGSVGQMGKQVRPTFNLV